MKQNNKKENFSVCYQGTLGASLLRNLLTGKGVMRAGEGAIVTSQGRVTTTACQSY